jgi:trimethylamine:corrinoid methyltransferase-like protein
MKHYRQRWYLDLFQRGNYDQRLAREAKDLVERATERVTRILGEHCPEPPPREVGARLRAVVQRTEEAFG